MFDVFYMFRTRGFIYRKAVVYTVMVWYIISYNYITMHRAKKYNSLLLNLFLQNFQKPVFPSCFTKFSILTFKIQSTIPPPKVKIAYGVPLFVSIISTHISSTDTSLCACFKPPDCGRGTRHHISIEP